MDLLGTFAGLNPLHAVFNEAGLAITSAVICLIWAFTNYGRHSQSTGTELCIIAGNLAVAAGVLYSQNHGNAATLVGMYVMAAAFATLLNARKAVESEIPAAIKLRNTLAWSWAAMMQFTASLGVLADDALGTPAASPVRAFFWLLDFLLITALIIAILAVAVIRKFRPRATEPYFQVISRTDGEPPHDDGSHS